MNVFCPHCRVLYRLDPRRVPESGAKARCSACGGVFPVARRDDHVQPALQPAGAAGTSIPAGPGAARTRSAAASGPPPAEPAAPRAGPTPPATAERQPWADPAAGAPGAPSVFGAQDPHVRARRIARALVSDIAAYHAERRDRALAAGTLRTDLRGEILRSWEEYVDQVGMELARGTPYFREALNEILARGRKIF